MKLILTIEILFFQEDYVIFSLKDHSLHFSDFSGVLMAFSFQTGTNISHLNQFSVFLILIVTTYLLYNIQNMPQ